MYEKDYIFFINFKPQILCFLNIFSIFSELITYIPVKNLSPIKFMAFLVKKKKKNIGMDIFITDI
jgi:hypothetical protein